MRIAHLKILNGEFKLQSDIYSCKILMTFTALGQGLLMHFQTMIDRVGHFKYYCTVKCEVQKSKCLNLQFVRG